MTTKTKPIDTEKEQSTPNNRKSTKSDNLVTTIRDGAIAASIWRRQTSTGFEYLDFSLSRSWKTRNGDKEGYSQSFFERNDDALVSVIKQAAEFIRDYPLETAPKPGESAPSLHGANRPTSLSEATGLRRG